MLALSDTPVKFVGLLVLFGFSTIWSLDQVGHRQTGPTLVSNIAHLAMSFVMLLMVPQVLWQPLAAIVGVPALAAFFAASTLWFVVLGVRGLRAGQQRGRRHGWHALGHAGMFGAMTWHLAAMLSMMHSSTSGARGLDSRASMHAYHPGVMPTAGMNHTTTVGQMDVAADAGVIVAIVGVPLMAYLMFAAVTSVKNAIRPGADLLDHRGHQLAGHGHYAGGNPRIGALADGAMSFGMAWMSIGLLKPLLPFLGSLS